MPAVSSEQFPFLDLRADGGMYVAYRVNDLVDKSTNC